MPCWYASETGRGRGARCNVPARLDGLFTYTLAQQEIGIVEILEKLGEERVAVCDDGFLDTLENTAVHALRVILRFEQEGRDRRDQYRLAHALRSVPPKVARHFAATHGETDQRKFMQFKLRHDLVQVLGESIIVVSRRWLAGLAESSAVIGDDTVTRSQKHGDLVLSGSTAQRISVN